MTSSLASPKVDGQVTFYDGSTSLGIAVLDAKGDAALTVPRLENTAHSLRAVYEGNAMFDTSTSSTLEQRVDPRPDAGVGDGGVAVQRKRRSKRREAIALFGPAAKGAS